VKYAIEIGALKAGEQLPGIRRVAEDLVINPNTVARAYRELEHEGLVELRQGAGAYITAGGGERSRPRAVETAQIVAREVITKLTELGLAEEEIRRLFEAELTRLREQNASQSFGRRK
jgi:GntR family transcriptional regulator